MRVSYVQHRFNVRGLLSSMTSVARSIESTGHPRTRTPFRRLPWVFRGRAGTVRSAKNLLQLHNDGEIWAQNSLDISKDSICISELVN